VPNGKPRTPGIDTLLHPRRPREEQRGSESGYDGQWLYARLQHGEEARGNGSQAAEGDPEPVARGAIGGEDPRRMRNGGAENDGAETACRPLHLRSQSGPELPGISRGIAQGFGEGATRVHLDPRNGNIMTSMDLVKKATDVLQDGLIAPSFNGE